MKQYRNYRGLYGETIPVAEDTIAPPMRFYRGSAFPFATLADKLGRDRDTLAGIAFRARPWFESVAERGEVRRLAEKAAA